MCLDDSHYQLRAIWIEPQGHVFRRQDGSWWCRCERVVPRRCGWRWRRNYSRGGRGRNRGNTWPWRGGLDSGGRRCRRWSSWKSRRGRGTGSLPTVDTPLQIGSRFPLFCRFVLFSVCRFDQFAGWGEKIINVQPRVRGGSFVKTVTLVNSLSLSLSLRQCIALHSGLRSGRGK